MWWKSDDSWWRQRQHGDTLNHSSSFTLHTWYCHYTLPSRIHAANSNNCRAVSLVYDYLTYTSVNSDSFPHTHTSISMGLFWIHEMRYYWIFHFRSILFSAIARRLCNRDKSASVNFDYNAIRFNCWTLFVIFVYFFVQISITLSLALPSIPSPTVTINNCPFI